jgi:protease I
MVLIGDFVEGANVIATICHAPWVLIMPCKATSYGSIKTDMINAGANPVDETVAADKGAVMSRNPGDLDAFVDKIVEEI